MYFTRFIFSPYFPNIIRFIPIVTANIHGPKRSPIVFDNPSAASAYADAHCAIASSDAPAHTIRHIDAQKRGILKSFLMPIPCPSSTIGTIGQVAKLKMLYAGISAHITASHFQLSIPNILKNKVDITIVPTVPQQ